MRERKVLKSKGKGKYKGRVNEKEKYNTGKVYYKYSKYKYSVRKSSIRKQKEGKEEIERGRKKERRTRKGKERGKLRSGIKRDRQK